MPSEHYSFLSSTLLKEAASLGADISSFVPRFVEKRLKERLKKENIDGGIILAVHDEIVSEIREDQADAWAKIQSEEMVRAGQLFLKKVSIASEPFVSDVWEH